MTLKERQARAPMPKEILCGNCGTEFPRGMLSPKNMNFCKPECRAEWKEKNRKRRAGFTDADAERIWQKNHGEAEKAYYTGFVYRPRISALLGSAETGGGIRRSINPRS